MSVQSEPATGSSGWSVLPLRGDIDLATAPSLRLQLNDLLETNSSVILDLGALDFIDSTGLGVLVGALRRVRATGGDIRLANPSASIGRVFSVTGLDQIFQLYPSVDTAAAS